MTSLLSTIDKVALEHIAAPEEELGTDVQSGELSTELFGLTEEQVTALEDYAHHVTPTPPGIEPGAINSSVPGIEDLVGRITDKLVFWRDLPTAFARKYGTVLSLEDASPLDPTSFRELIKSTLSKGYPHLRTHLRALSTKVPPGAEFRVLGSKIVLTFTNGGMSPSEMIGDVASMRWLSSVGVDIDKGWERPENYIKDTVTVVFDLAAEDSSKQNGIRIDSVFQTRGSDGLVWEVLEYAPKETKFYMKGFSLLAKILMPLRTRLVAAGADHRSGNVSVYHVQRSFPSLALHEANHIYDLIDMKKENAGVDKYGTTYGVLTLTTGFSLAAALGLGNPWFLTIPLVASIATYIRSRQKGSELNKSFVTLMQTERKSYLMDAILRMLMQNNGFAIDQTFTGSMRDMHSTEHLRPLSKPLFYMVYQPPVWGVIDMIRELLSGKEREIEGNERGRVDGVPVGAGMGIGG